VGEDEKAYITAILEKSRHAGARAHTGGLDEADVIEEALKRIPARPIINSINLEDGEKRTLRSCPWQAATGRR